MYDIMIIILCFFALIIGIAIVIVIIQACAILGMLIKEITPTSASFTKNNRNAEPLIHDKPATGSLTKLNKINLEVPDLDPNAIAPNLSKPPKAAGEFGKKIE